MPLGTHACGNGSQGHFRRGLGLQFEVSHDADTLAFGLKFELDRAQKVVFLQASVGPFQFALGILYAERAQPEIFEIDGDPPDTPPGPLN